MRSRFQEVLCATVAAALTAVISLPTNANAFSVTATGGTWTDTNPSYAWIIGVNTSTISWGAPLGGGYSQYIYAGTPTPFPVSLGSPFNLGTFTHNNQPVEPPWLQTAELTVNTALDITSDNVADITLASVFDFVHEETPNMAGTCAYGATNGPCNDRVTFSLNNGKTTSVNIGGVEYVLTLTGFVIPPNTNPVSQFITAENASNVATLQGILVDRQTVVPLPAALPMFLSALAGLGLISRRKA